MSESSAAAFFDLDKTIIATSSTLAMGRSFYAAGMIGRRAVLKGAYARLVYHLGEVDAGKMDRMRDDLARAVVGWEAAKVHEVIEADLLALIDPLIYDEAAALIESHQAAGRAVVIVSSSGDEVVGPIGELLGADEVVASRMVVEDGRYTGEVAFYAFGPHKAEAMREMAAARGWDLADCYAYTDSATDLPMLEAVGHPHAVNPDRTLRRAAVERGWTVLAFRHPVPLRERLGKIPTPPRSVTVGIAGAAVVAAAAGWRALSHQRRAG
ncbi:MAG TPA: HAD family hydrolase [Mycobacteriales bacterium]|jgi:HAD superfamily hydrolase (TIGR01490 family)|nr:HAD family hydrolase [Mycobacteriales bacterium]